MPTYARLKNADSIEVDYIRSVAGAAMTFPEGLKTDTIAEETAAAGVTIDGVLLKDGAVVVSSFSTDLISEKTPAAGVTIDGVLLKDNSVTVGAAGFVSTDTISEKTAAAGVTIDGVLLKDSAVNSATFQNTGGTVTLSGSTGATVTSAANVVLAAGTSTVEIRSTGGGATATWKFSSKNLIPAVANDGDVGSSTYYVKSLYLNQIVLNSALAVSGTGSDQAGAAALTAGFNRVTGGALDSGVILPTNPPTGAEIEVVNDSGTYIKVYPQSGGGAIIGGSGSLGANVAQRMVTGSVAVYRFIGGGGYRVILYAVPFITST